MHTSFPPTFERQRPVRWLNTETVRQHKDGTLIDVSLSVVPIKENGLIRSLSVTMEDIRDRKRRESHILLLNRELAHRVKNTLAVVQLIANQTMRSTPDPGEFRRLFKVGCSRRRPRTTC